VTGGPYLELQYALRATGGGIRTFHCGLSQRCVCHCALLSLCHKVHSLARYRGRTPRNTALRTSAQRTSASTLPSYLTHTRHEQHSCASHIAQAQFNNRPSSHTHKCCFFAFGSCSIPVASGHFISYRSPCVALCSVSHALRC
jgi:hypothetical protein